MALLDDCFFCSLPVAASVISVYTMVAYVIAFLMETWWIGTAPVWLPSPAYVLSAIYLLVSVFSAVLLRGLSIKKSLFLLVWLLVVAALSVPEAILVYFMSIHYWNIRSLYGLMELTCWICRAVINVSGMICVQSLYANWREEKDVLRRLRDLNMTRVIPNRRNSVSSQNNGYIKSSSGPGVLYSIATAQPPQLLNNGATLVPTIRRSGSMVSMMSRPQTPGVAPASMPPLSPLFPLGNVLSANEFSASQFNLSLVTVPLPLPLEPPVNRGRTRTLSLADLRVPTPSSAAAGRKAMSVVDFPLDMDVAVAPARAVYTQSLDRRLMRRQGSGRAYYIPSVEEFYASGRMSNAYFPPFGNDHNDGAAVQNTHARAVMYGRNINAFNPSKMGSRSKQSLGSESDDFQKYRDVAL